MSTSAAISGEIENTSVRGWAVLMLNRLQLSSVVLSSFVFGIFLPFIAQDLDLSPLEAGLLQGIWWVTWAITILPFGVWFSRFRPVPLVLVSLILLTPFLFLQGLATNFYMLFLARFLVVLFHSIAVPARPLLFQQWAAPRQYALINAAGLSQHSLLLAIAVSTSALLIAALGSWRLAYFIQGSFHLLQIVAWLLVARENRAPVKDLGESLRVKMENPWLALKAYPQCWQLAMVMFALSATWTGIVTFLPTLLLEDRGIAITLGGPILAFLYYGLIPGALLGGYVHSKAKNRKLLLTVTALLNVLLGIAITVTTNPFMLAVFITALGLVWIVFPVIELLPFEYHGIRPREVAIIAALVNTVSGLGFALGPIIVGAIAQITGSLQTGLLVLAFVTGVGVMAGLLYPSYQTQPSSPT